MCAITPEQINSTDLARVVDEVFGQVLRALEGGTSGPEVHLRSFCARWALTLTMGTRWQRWRSSFVSGVENTTLLREPVRSFRVMEASVAGIEHLLAPDTSFVLHVVCISVDERLA